MDRLRLVVAASVVAVLMIVPAVIGIRNRGVSAKAASGDPQKQSFLSRLSSRLRPAPAPVLVTVPAGTKIHVRLIDAISTERNSSGDLFQASLDGPLTVDGKLVSPGGSRIVGQLTNVTPSGRVEGRARLTMVLRKLAANEKEYELSTPPMTLAARSTRKKDAAIIGGGGAAGALIGGLAGGGKGALIGAGVGGGSGTAYVLATKGAPVAYGPESRFTFALSTPLQLPVAPKAN